MARRHHARDAIEARRVAGLSADKEVAMVTMLWSKRLAAACAVLALAAANAIAGAPAPDRTSEKVSLAGLDLATDAGRAVAMARIDASVQRLCERFYDERRISARETRQDCIQDARRSARLLLSDGARVASSAPAGR